MRAHRVGSARRPDGGRRTHWLLVAAVAMSVGALAAGCTSTTSSDSGEQDLSTVGVCDATSVAERVVPACGCPPASSVGIRRPTSR